MGKCKILMGGGGTPRGIVAKYPISPNSKPIKINEFVQLLPAKTVGELQDVFALQPGEVFFEKPLIQKLSETRFLLCYGVSEKHVRARVIRIMDGKVTIGTELTITTSSGRPLSMGIGKDNKVLVVTSYNGRYGGSLDVCELNIEGLNITLVEKNNITSLNKNYRANILDAATIIFANSELYPEPFSVGIYNLESKKVITTTTITGSMSGNRSSNISIGAIQDKFYVGTDVSFCTFKLDGNRNIQNIDVLQGNFGQEIVVVDNIIFGVSINGSYNFPSLNYTKASYDNGIYTMGPTKSLLSAQYVSIHGLSLLHSTIPILFSADSGHEKEVFSFFNIRSESTADYDPSRIINNASGGLIVVIDDKAFQYGMDANISKFKMIYPFYPLVASNTGFTDGVAKQSGKANDIIKIITKK